MAAGTVGLKRIACEIRKDIVRITHAAQMEEIEALLERKAGG